MGDLRNRVMQVISYNPVSGEFRNLIRRSNALAGDISGNIGPNGYLTIMIDYRSYYAHHLAILIQTGLLPPKKSHVDHIDGNKSNNRISNLRVTTSSLNGHNRKKANKNSSTGHRGIYLRPSGKIYAKVVIQRQQISIGTFCTIEEAVVARKEFCRARGLTP